MNPLTLSSWRRSKRQGGPQGPYNLIHIPGQQLSTLRDSEVVVCESSSDGILPVNCHFQATKNTSPATLSSDPSQQSRTNLQALQTSYSSEYERRASTQSTRSLPSPSLVAARAYYLHHKPPIGQYHNVQWRRRSLFEGQHVPKRHSALAQPGDIATHVACLNLTSPGRASPSASTTPPDAIVIKLEEEEELIPSSQMKKGTTTGDPGSLSTRSNGALHVPFQFSHDHLREWGYVYFGNAATADVFINAVNLRRPSLVLVMEEGVSSNLVTIRARVLPKEKERRPFLIQRQLDVEELRASIPPTHGPRQWTPTSGRRSSRGCRIATQQVSNITMRRENAVTRLSARSKCLGKSSAPIHIEYAVHYLPVLAALMLSGHIKKGDTIDLPVPHPESWSDTISYIYMGREAGEVTTCMRDNILHLGGNI